MRRGKSYDCFIGLYFVATIRLCYGLPGALSSQTGSQNSLINDVDPDFSEAITNVTVPVGREAILSCSVTDLGHFKVGWLKAEDQTILTLHNKVVTHNARISVSHDSGNTWQLHIRQVKESDRGCYMCQINTNKMKKQLGCVDVHVPPDIIDEETSSDVTVREGENATLVCRAKGHPVPRIIWRREDGEHLQFRSGSREIVRGKRKMEMASYTVLQNSRGPSVDVNFNIQREDWENSYQICYNGLPVDSPIAFDSYLNDTFSLTKVSRIQMGAYLCIASNDVPPAVSKRVMLNINFPPSIKIPNQLLGAPFGTNVLMECLVEAFPNTINYWMKSRGEMLLNGRKHMIEEEKNSYKVHLKLTVANFSKNDLGTYLCVSTNSLGRADGTIRLYEIKVPTSVPTTTTEVSIPSTAVVKTTVSVRITDSKKRLSSVITIAPLHSVREESSLGRSSTFEKDFHEINASEGRCSHKLNSVLVATISLLCCL